jgi:diguanylate cyclase (GGDEF)-like protein
VIPKVTPVQKPILILDDDPLFRSSLVEILQSHGLSSVQAGNGEEADRILQEIEPVLAIVDYRLPKQDGINWITCTREKGKNFPIIFISNTWCDPKTFSWLRSILKVSLVLQKPIVPELFLQQIECILPAQIYEQKPLGGEVPIQVALRSTQVDLPSLAADPEKAESSNRKNEQLEKLAIAKANYATGLAKSWDELSQAVNSSKDDPKNPLPINEARAMAHRLAGTAGSLGFRRTGEIAAKIEHLLSMIDPNDNLQDLVWSDILHNITEGAKVINEAVKACDEPSKPSVQKARKIILFGKLDSYIENIRNLNTEIPAEIEVTEVLSVANIYPKKAAYDAAIFDLTLADQATIFQLARELRSLPGYATLPLGFISRDDENLQEDDLVYAGCSELIFGVPTKADIEEACNKLLLLAQLDKPRILAVDDDEALTAFIADILHAEGMVVSTLNNPIEIVKAASDFKPDLIVLDVVMPGLSGYDVSRMLRNSEQVKSPAIVFLTSKTDKDGRAAAFQAGGNDFLSKPVVVEELITRVKAQVAQARKNLGVQEKDQLTGVRSSIDFVKSARELIEIANREDSAMTICLLKVDDFSNMGAVHGWQAAQDTLVTLGDLIQRRFRVEELRARFGEDGFGMAFPNGKQDIIAAAVTKLLDEFSEHKFSSGSTGSFKVSFSAGIAEYPDEGKDFQTLLNTANRRLLGSAQLKTGSISFVG